MANKNVIWCDPSTLQKDLQGKIYIVTGANSGVGLETSKQLITQGAHVIMACRRVDAGLLAAESFLSLKGSFEVSKVDFSDLQSVREFVERFKENYSKLDGLMCNAGALFSGDKAKYTKDGFEMSIGVSYFGHFLLTELLLELLISTKGSRIGILSSVGHAGSPKKRYQVHLDDIHWKSRKYNSVDAYCEAKVAVNLYALELADRLKNTDVSTASVHPGWARSNFGGNGSMMKILRILLLPFSNSITNSNEESAQTSLHVLLSDDAPKHSGAYFSQHSVLYRDKECKKGGWPMTSPNPNARDLNTAKKLVALSNELVGLA
ncbi:SDR family NAD(P)-dependent oxidoreductase [Flammeovirga agarivorans]|uniref:SDR family NAD(P)-dependent oxidoreductase n=1 Tax=Flammeovirga agarivorans TaxID=2726742 RepID=A0A7X8XVM5_9BACT|nr:SDR family NAD(P)-dependent oxidoreductase [Flammeovirga agarivorans]NLR91488.1 SDR family NAD(P)-dependent oxidoreductase [Flammeovirga agarivorans]